MKKRLMMILSVMLIALTCAFAAQEMTVTWEWRIDDDPEVNYYRWQLNGTDPDGWRIESGDTGEITVKELDPYQSYTLYLQRSYDGVNWSETASAEAAALLVEEVAEEAPVEDIAAVPEAPAEVAPVEEAPALDTVIPEIVPVLDEVVPAEETAVIGGADEVTEIVVAEEPAKEKAPSRFEFSLLVRPGANLSLDYAKKGVVSGAQSSLSPFAIGLDFANIVSNDKVGFGMRANISADAYAVNGWGSFLGSPKWNPLKWQWGKMFDIADSYAWALTGSAVAELNARAGIADFNVGLGFGGSALLDVHGRNMGAQLTKFHFQNLFKTPADLALFADLQLGMRFYLGSVVSLGIESDYKMYVPNFKQGDVSVNAVMGFTF